MAGRNGSRLDRWRIALTTHSRNLDAGCRQYSVGGRELTATMFRAVRLAFQIAVLAFAVWLVEFVGVSWEVAVGVAVLFISGPEGLETWLARKGLLDTDDDS